jgi:hypothetical protein
LLGAGGHDDDVAAAQNLDVVGPLERAGRCKQHAMVQVKHFGAHLGTGNIK